MTHNKSSGYIKVKDSPSKQVGPCVLVQKGRQFVILPPAAAENKDTFFVGFQREATQECETANSPRCCWQATAMNMLSHLRPCERFVDLFRGHLCKLTSFGLLLAWRCAAFNFAADLREFRPTTWDMCYFV